MFSKNVRVFRYGVSHSGENLWEPFITQLKIKLINALKRILSKQARTGKVLHKRQNKKTYPNIFKRRIGMINYAKQTVEYTTNFLLMHELKYQEKLVPFSEGHNTICVNTKSYKKIESVFEKFRARFKKEEYHDPDGNIRKIQHCYQRIDELEENIHLLVKMFFDDIGKIELSV